MLEGLDHAPTNFDAKYLHSKHDGVITVTVLNLWEYLTPQMKDSGGSVRSLVASLSGTLTYNGSMLIDLTYLTANFTTTSALTTLLNAKQATISVGAGAFLAGTQISGYDLRWNTNSVPSASIRALHFKNGLDVSQSQNLASGQIELVVEHPSSHPISTITGLQARLDTIDMLYSNTGVPGVSLGPTSHAAMVIANHRYAIYHEISTGHWW